MKVDFDAETGLAPVIIQDHETQRVLMLGYMNAAALAETEKSGRVTFYSRSREKLWVKGETSGNTLAVKDIAVDCDRDTLLIKAQPAGPVCHTGRDTCFNESNTRSGDFLPELVRIIRSRKTEPRAGSYTADLFRDGVKRIAQKVGEEATELILEAAGSDEALFKEEAADLIYHFLVLLEAKGISLADVDAKLRERHGVRS